MSVRVLAIVPAKKNSRRLPGKNMRMLGGKPLLQHVLDALTRCETIDDAVVSTDSADIRAFCETRGVRVPYLMQPEHAAEGVPASVPVIHMLDHLGGEAAYTHCVMLPPTSPFRTASSIDAAVRLSVGRNTNVVSATALPHSLLHVRTVSPEGTLRRISKRLGPEAALHETSPLHVLNGSIYCAPTRPLLWSRTFLYGEPTAHVMPAWESVDIDTEEDLRLAEAWLVARSQGGDAEAVA